MPLKPFRTVCGDSLELLSWGAKLFRWFCGMVTWIVHGWQKSKVFRIVFILFSVSLLVALGYHIICWRRKKKDISHGHDPQYQSLYQYFLHLFLFQHPSSVSYRDGNSYLPPSSIPSSFYSPNEGDPVYKEEKKQERKRSKGEEECKRIVERYFNKSFDTVRPRCLENPVTKEKLELDLYNDELRLAIEYNGRQHYEYVPFLHQNSKDRFYNMQYRDILKKDMCEKQGIHLITVDYRCPDIETYLVKEFRRYENKSSPERESPPLS